MSTSAEDIGPTINHQPATSADALDQQSHHFASRQIIIQILLLLPLLCPMLLLPLILLNHHLHHPLLSQFLFLKMSITCALVPRLVLVFLNLSLIFMPLPFRLFPHLATVCSS